VNSRVQDLTGRSSKGRRQGRSGQLVDGLGVYTKPLTEARERPTLLVKLIAFVLVWTSRPTEQPVRLSVDRSAPLA